MKMNVLLCRSVKIGKYVKVNLSNI